MDWSTVDGSRLFTTIRSEAAQADGEQMIWALEQVLGAARVDPALLDHLAAAAICALAYRDDDTPRGVAGKLTRRAVADERWRHEYAQLLAD